MYEAESPIDRSLKFIELYERTLKSFTPTINLPQSGFSNEFIYQIHMSHISCWKINCLKSVYYRVTLSFPLISATLFHWTKGQSPTKSEGHVYFPNAEYDTWHTISVQLRSITWMSESTEYYWDPTPSSVEILSCPLLEIYEDINFPDGQAKNTYIASVADIVCSLSHP